MTHSVLIRHFLLSASRPAGETPGGQEQEAGDKAEDPQGARGLRRQNRRRGQAAAERAGGADRQPDARPGEAARRAGQEAEGGGGQQEKVSRAS